MVSSTFGMVSVSDVYISITAMIHLLHLWLVIYYMNLSCVSLTFLLAVTNDGNKLAIACSDLNILDKPKDEIPPPTIKVRYVNDKNVNPNNKPEAGKEEIK